METVRITLPHAVEFEDAVYGPGECDAPVRLAVSFGHEPQEGPQEGTAPEVGPQPETEAETALGVTRASLEAVQEAKAVIEAENARLHALLDEAEEKRDRAEGKASALETQIARFFTPELEAARAALADMQRQNARLRRHLELEALTVPKLLPVAKEAGVEGADDLDKARLVGAILDRQFPA